MKLMTVTVVTLADAIDKLEFIMISAVRQGQTYNNLTWMVMKHEVSLCLNRQILQLNYFNTFSSKSVNFLLISVNLL